MPDEPLLPPGALRATAAALLLYALLTLAVTWPLPAQVGSVAIGDYADPLIVAAVMAWDWRWFAAPRTALFAAPFVHPYPNGLAFSGHGLGLALLGLPLHLAGLAPLAIYNSLTLASFPLTGAAAFLLALALTRSRGGAFLAGLVAAFAPFRLLRLPHIEVLHGWALPLCLLALLAFCRQPTAGRALALAAAAILQSLLYVYSMVHLMVLLPAATLLLAARYPAVRTARGLLLLTAAGVAAAAVLLPVMLPYQEVARDMGLQRALGSVVAPDGWARYLGVPAAAPLWGRWLSRFDMPEGALFPGACALLLAAIGSVARWPVPSGRALALLLLATALLLSAGPRSSIGGLDTGMVYRALHHWLPGFSGARVAARWHGVTLLALGLLAAGGWRVVRQRWRGRALPAAALAVLAAGIVAEGYQPPALVAFPPALQAPETVRQLRDMPPGAVIQVPVEWFSNMAMFHGITHGHPVVQASTSQTVPLLEALLALDPSDTLTMPLLASLGVRYVLVRHAADTDGAWRMACAADTRLRRVGADAYGTLFVLAGRGERLLAVPDELDDPRGTRLPDGTLLVSLALPGTPHCPVITRQRFVAAELTLLAGAAAVRTEGVRLELPPYAAGQQRAVLAAAPAAADRFVLRLAGREWRGEIR